MKQSTALVLLILGAFACTTKAAGDQPSAHPAVFNSDTAMLAIYGEYNHQHKGTLIPLKSTDTWNMKDARILATPILAVTYTERGKKKGVIAIQRQSIVDGEIDDSHATAPEISVYVFAYNGKEWGFEMGKQKVTQAGTHGVAPDAKLIRTGRDQYGLLFQGEGMGQGISSDYAFIIALDAPVPSDVIHLETGGDNAGEADKGWSWKAVIEFVENGSSDYFVLRLTSKGTREDDNGKVRRINRSDYYVYADGKYHLSTDGKYGAWKTVDPKVIYNAGRGEER